jgi:hypothetical protein
LAHVASLPKALATAAVRQAGMRDFETHVHVNTVQLRLHGCSLGLCRGLDG